MAASSVVRSIALTLLAAAPSYALAPIVTPEPSTFVLMAAGLGVAVWALRKKRKT